MSWRIHPRLSWAAAAVLVLAVLAAWGNGLSVPFVYDDVPDIVENHALAGPLGSLWKNVPAGLATRPVIQLSLAVNHALGGLDPFGYHLFNVAAHALAAVLLFGVLLETFSRTRASERFGTHALPLSFFIALLWAVHPLQTESVTYVIQRCESLMGMFFLLTLYLAIRGFRSPRPGRWHAAAVAAFFLAAGSKEVAAAAPLVILLHDCVFEGRGPGKSLANSPVLYGGLAAGLLALGAFQVLGGATAADAGDLTTYTRSEYFLTQGRVVLHYLGKALFPDNLSFSQYWIPRGLAGSLPAVAVAGALLAASAWGAFRRSPAGFAGLWFFLILAPSSSLVPLICLAAEHRMYLPLAAPVALVVAGGWRVGAALSRFPDFSGPRARAAGRWGGVAILATLAVILVFQTRMRNHVYRTETALWWDTAKKSPDNPLALYNLGTCLLSEGDTGRAEALFRRAVALSPGIAGPHYNLANILAKSGRMAEARDEYEAVLAINPGHVMARMNLGNAYLLLDQPEKAEDAYRRVTDLAPADPRGWRNLGLVQARLGNRPAAVQSLSRALDLDPADPAARRVLESLGALP